MIIGLLAGIGTFLIMALFTWMACDFEPQIKGKALIISFAIVFIIGGTAIGKTVNDADYESFIERYKVTQQIYHSSLVDEKLSGFERVELVKMANEKSVELANRKVKMWKWWNFGLNSNLIEQIDKLEIIA